ncbi:lipopolysaccharide biosynthesis protein [Peribacillus frigoritolerans]|uniref:lipopolysaccharide biosynthesis protein n=1 Tax=Peribacillus frigoritolerans TaxID=450367 RepID=UPI0035173009
MNNNRMLINIIAQIISFSVNIGISFFLTSFIIEHIGKDIFGFWGLANNFISYITVFTIAINSMVSRFISIHFHQDKIDSANKYFSTVAITNIVVSLTLTFPTLFLIFYLDKIINIPKNFIFDVKLLWLFLFFNFFINLIGSIYDVGTFVRNRLDLSAWISINSNLIRGLSLLILFYFFAPNLWYVGLSFLFCTFYLVIAKFRIMKKLTPEIKINRKNFNWNYLKELMVIGSWNSINQLNQVFINGLNLLITNLFIGTTQMSLLSVAITIPMQIQNFVQIIASTFTPNLTAIYANGKLTQFIREVITSMKITTFIGSVPIVGLVVFGNDFFALWLPTLSVDEINIIQILSILTLLPMLINTIVNPLFNVNTITAKVKIPVITNCIIGILNIILVYIFIKYTDLGVYAVAGVSAILSLARMLFFVPIYSSIILKVKFFRFYKVILRGIFSLIILTFLFNIVNGALYIESWMSLIVICILSAILGYILNFLIIFNKEEKSKIYIFLKRKFNT